jgi:2-polyprenyl-6-methoxyphenol hydroxylase-like FAD-dependent oxidoreductase
VVRILISGAGVAGLACARQLGSRGHDVTIVESAERLRTEGTPIDIRGHAIETAARMGVLGSIRQRRVRMSENAYFIDSRGEPVARVPLADINDTADDVELLRGDLVQILAADLPDTVAVRFGDQIRTLLDHDGGVDANFASGRSGRYDVIVGADGQHSAVRRLCFGPDAECLQHLGVYFAIAALPGDSPSDCANVIFNVPGRMAGCFRYGDRAVAVFQFRSAAIDYDHRDLTAQKRMLIEAFAGHRSWKIPELLDAARADPEFYFTAAGQIRLPTWGRGRVVLVGDAGYCPSFLSGRGTSLALSGAVFLAEELERRGEDHVEAFAHYEDRMRHHVISAQNRVHAGRDRMLPETWDDIAARNHALRARGNAP